MHRGDTWHDYPFPWVSLTWLLYNLQLVDVLGAYFENSSYALGQSEKREQVERMIIITMDIIDSSYGFYHPAGFWNLLCKSALYNDLTISL